MRRHLFLATLCVLIVGLAAPGFCAPSATISGSEFKAGDTDTIEGAIEPGQELNWTVSMQEMFAAKDTSGAHEVTRQKKDAAKGKYELDTQIPPVYYFLTTNPTAFGENGKYKFGGPSVLLGMGICI